MWVIYEHKNLSKKITHLPSEVLKRYEKWKDVITLSGLEGLRLIKGFHDEALKGKWQGYRSSRLGLQYRVVYTIIKEAFVVQVIDINPHDYRR